jgi:hypothetical protein
MPPKKDKMKVVADKVESSKATTSAVTAMDNLKIIMPMKSTKPKMARSPSRPDS